MDHKTWLWGKKSKEKTIPTTDKVYVPMNENPMNENEEVEVRTLLRDVELENEIKLLKDKLSSVISECDAKDEVVEEKTMMAQEAAAGCEKAEAEAAFLRKQLDEALKWRMANEERTMHLDAALKECMQQLHFVREEQESRIHDAITKTSKEYEKLQMAAEEKLEDTRKKLAKVGAENASLSEAVSVKEKEIVDLNKQRVQLESDLNGLMIRLEMIEKENASLKYEVRVMGKEIEIRNEEREFNRRTAEASHKQHLESVKKIAKLESECQRLRLLVRKRLPGPAALSKMRNEVEMLGRESIEFRRRKSTPALTDQTVSPAIDAYTDAASRNVNLLLEQLYSMEEENKAIKEALIKKTNELQHSKVMHCHSTSKLSEVESQLEELPKGDLNMEQIRSSVMSHGSSWTYASDVGNDDKASYAESWPSAVISELDLFRNGKLRESPSSKTVGSSDMSLMDDFLEMEKLALTTIDKPSQDNPSLKEANLAVSPLQSTSTEVTGMELVPVTKSHSEFGLTQKKIESTNALSHGYPDWLQKILQLIFTQAHATQKQMSEVLEDVKKAVDDMEGGDYLCQLDPHVTDSISWKPSTASSPMGATVFMADNPVSPAEMSTLVKGIQLQPELSTSIYRIIELIKGIQLQSSNSIQQTSNGECVSSGKQMEESSGYITLVFQWKTAELSVTLQVLIHACYDLINGNIDFAKFAQELAFTLDWIMKNCFSFQDVSSIRHESKHSYQDDPDGSEAEVVDHLTESGIPGSQAPSGCNSFRHKDEGLRNGEEHKEPVDELSSTKAANDDLACNDLPSTEMNGNLMNQLPESANTTGKLQLEPKPLEKTVEVIQEQVHNQELVTKLELNGSLEKLSLPKPEPVAEIEPDGSLQMVLSLPEPDNDSGSGRFEKTCEDSDVKEEARYPESKQEEIQLHTDWEITVASEKLAECQEAILNLGKQYKALASPTGAAIFDKLISAPGNNVNTLATTSEQLKGNMTTQRSSLREQMLAEDGLETKQVVPSQTKAVDSTCRPVAVVAKSKGNDASVIGAIEHLEKILLSSESTRYKDDDGGSSKSVAIVHGKKQGVGSLWKKLLWRKRKSISKTKPPSFKQNTK